MIINDLDDYYIVFDTKNRNTELDTLANNIATNVILIPLIVIIAILSFCSYEISTSFSYHIFCFTYRGVLLSIDPFHQFVWCKYLHLGETKPLLAQVLNGCTNVIYIIVYTEETVM